MMKYIVIAFSIFYTGQARASEFLLSEFSSDLVPSPVEYAVIAPDGYQDMKDLPVILNLHGGGGSRDNLKRQQPLFEKLWSDSEIPDAIVVTPSVTKRCFYMNYMDGKERWEDFITGPFLEHLRAAYPVSKDPKRTFLMGASMGGMGSLRIAFRYPEKFGAVAALEPGIEPILRYEDMRMKHRFWRSDKLLETAYGKPVDSDYWAANNPATMAIKNADSIRKSDIQIYIEAGDEDQFWLYEGAEFLHQILWQAKIKHEYHLVRGADHVGPSIGQRSEEAIKFLFRSYNPWDKPPLRQRVVIKLIEMQKLKLNEKDHYNQPD